MKCKGTHTKINTGGLKIIRMNMARQETFSYLMILYCMLVIKIGDNMDPLQCCLYFVICVIITLYSSHEMVFR